MSRLKRLVELKKLQKNLGNANDAVENFRPNIFWKDKDMVKKQVEIWTFDNICVLLDDVNQMEINYKQNSNLSNNLIFDLILNTSNS